MVPFFDGNKTDRNGRSFDRKVLEREAQKFYAMEREAQKFYAMEIADKYFSNKDIVDQLFPRLTFYSSSDTYSCDSELATLSYDESSPLNYDPHHVELPVELFMPASRYMGEFDLTVKYSWGDIVRKEDGIYINVSCSDDPEWELLTPLKEMNEEKEDKKSNPHPVRCECCGAVLTSWKCEYCGAEYFDK